MYPDMPWMVTGDGSIDDIRNVISQAWENRAAWRSRLFAFGYDACQLMLAMSARAAIRPMRRLPGSPASCISTPSGACSAI